MIFVLLPILFSIALLSLFDFGDDESSDGADPKELRGTDGDDLIIGSDGDETISGLAGDDVIDTGDGDDTAWGGEGNDLVSGLDLEAAQNNEAIFHTGDKTLGGGDGDDAIIGGAGNDQLYGHLGNDLLDGGPGNNSLYGGYGNDSLEGRDVFPNDADWTPDYLDGGAGNDLFTVDGQDELTLGDGFDLVQVLGAAPVYFENGPIVVNDYVPGEDAFLIETNGTPPDPTFTAVAVEGGANIVFSGQAVFFMKGVAAGTVNLGDFNTILMA